MRILCVHLQQLFFFQNILSMAEYMHLLKIDFYCAYRQYELFVHVMFVDG